jgi:hypothetical protein
MKGYLTAGLVLALAAALAACASSAEGPTELELEAAPGAEVERSERPTSPAVAPDPAPAAGSSTPAAARPPAAPQPRAFEIPARTALTFTLIDSVSTDGNKVGDTFRASLADDIVIDGQTVIWRNAIASGRVVAIDEPGRVSGRARIELMMTTVQAGGQAVVLRTAPFIAEADPTLGRDAAIIGGGAGVGAAIGGILGGGRGAVIGGAIGGGGGTAVVLATRGNQIEFPPETRLVFSLNEPARVFVRAPSY